MTESTNECVQMLEWAKQNGVQMIDYSKGAVKAVFFPRAQTKQEEWVDPHTGFTKSDLFGPDS